VGKSAGIEFGASAIQISRAPRSFSNQAILPRPGGDQLRWERSREYLLDSERLRTRGRDEKTTTIRIRFMWIYSRLASLPHRQPLGKEVRQSRAPDLGLHSRNIVLLTMVLDATALRIVQHVRGARI
jgi:hypothetical protein